MWLGMDKSPTTGDFNFVDGTPVNWNRWIAWEKKTNGIVSFILPFGNL